MKIALAQISLIIGDFTSNLEIIKKSINEAIKNNVDLIIFPELTTTVKGAKDLLHRNEYLSQAENIIKEIISYSDKISILIGAVTKNNNNLINSALLIKNNEVNEVATLNSVDVSDLRYFTPNKLNEIFEIEGTKFYPVLGNDIYYELSDVTVDYIIHLNSTPFIKNTDKEIFKDKNIISINHIGLAQELIFDGGAFLSKANGETIVELPRFEEQLQIIDLNNLSQSLQPKVEKEENIFKALSFAFREFCRINRFSKALIGLSGGIDSALTAVIMCDAIGAENVLGITMPSKYSTEGSWKDSYDLANNLNMECQTIPIKPLFDTFINDIQGKSYFDLAEENLQARLRGNILMAYSNRENRVLVSTGNKSEVAMGYCTLYGDTCGGINLISDLYKQEVYALSNWINREKEIIPTNTITKAPSAELRPNQKDQDSLPEYEVLDEILYRFVEENQTIDEISEKFDKKLVCEIINKFNGMEFKRNQLTYCLKISTKALLDRNYPVVNRFRY